MLTVDYFKVLRNALQLEREGTCGCTTKPLRVLFLLNLMQENSLRFIVLPVARRIHTNPNHVMV